jgi:predicted kinase
MPTLYLLIGVPGSGKSTWIKNQNFDWGNTIIASTDDEIEALAQQAGKTYNDVFHDEIKNATAKMMQNVQHALRSGVDIVWDQTNTGVKNRAPKLAMIPKSYRKVAVVFPTPGAVELGRRLASRAGKNIPDHVMRSMIANLQMPTEAEGFDEVITV